eukprot:1244612-Rhodomonas_salina.1
MAAAAVQQWRWLLTPSQALTPHLSSFGSFLIAPLPLHLPRSPSSPLKPTCPPPPQPSWPPGSGLAYVSTGHRIARAYHHRGCCLGLPPLLHKRPHPLSPAQNVSTAATNGSIAPNNGSNAAVNEGDADNYGGDIDGGPASRDHDPTGAGRFVCFQQVGQRCGWRVKGPRSGVQGRGSRV